MTMNTTYKISLRIALLAAVLLVMSFIYNIYFFEKDIQKHSDVVNLVRAIPDDADIIYLGESSNISFREDDLDKRPISALISDYFVKLNLYDITKPASHAGIYKTLLTNIPDNSNIKTVIVTLNLRSFNATWIYSELETSLQKSMVLLQDYPGFINRFLLSFKAFDVKTEDEREKQMLNKWKNDILNFPYPFPYKNVIEWDYSMACSGIKDSLGNIDKKTELACHYIKTYGFQIDTINNPRIKDFNQIIELAKERGWKLVFNLLAENHEKAQELVGDDLIFLMEQNRKLLVNYFDNKGVSVVDNLNSVASEQFIDQNWTTEHYAEKGRKIIARNLAQKIKELYPEEYSEVDYSNSIQTSFFNDCEKKTIWEQMQTISEDISFSGKYSSKTGIGDDFSITFGYPLKLIPDSLKNNIKINLKIFQNSNNHKGQINIEASGEEFNYYVNGIPIEEQIKGIKTWEDFNYTFQIPDSLKQADLIKIYLYNPSNELIFIDDFKVDFE